MTSVKDVLKSMYDSLVRTYSPMFVGAILAWLATLLPIIPTEIENGFVILIGLLFQVVWYFIARAIEVAQGHTSKLLTLGLTKAEPVYGEVIAQPTEDVVVVDTTTSSVPHITP